jgi:putative membrane protein
MMKKTALFLAVMVTLTACKKDESGEYAASDTTAAATATMPADTTTTSAAALTDAQIAAIVVAANDVDVKVGEQAKSKAADQKVKDFGQRMITDHTAVNKQATDLVTKLNVTPEENPTSQALRQGGEQTLAQLQGLTGAAYDKAYIDHEVQFHQQVIDAVDQQLIPNAQNAELKTLLEQVRPALQGHLEMAKQIQGQLPS